jgi:CHAT domain-containing protein/tetratricopeptide (TPR) repeat protein
MNRRLLAALLLLCSACGYRSPESLRQDFAHAVALFRQGKLAEARDQIRVAAKRCGADLPCRWRLRLLDAEILIYIPKPDEARALLFSEDLPPGPEFAALRVRRQMLQGFLLSLTKGPAGSQLLEQAYQQASHLGLRELQAEIDLLQAWALGPRDPAAARARILEARDLAVQQKDPYNEAAALNDLGMMSLEKHRYDEAIPWFTQGLGLARQADARPLVTAAFNNLALCHTQLGAYDEALKLQQEALVWLGRGEVQVVRRDLVGEMGRTLALKGDTAKAIDYYRQALALSRSKDVSGERRWSSNMAAALAAIGDWDAAEKANQEELTLARDNPSKAYASLNAATILAGRKRFEEAAVLYNKALGMDVHDPSILWESHAGLARAYAAAGKKALARPQFEKAIEIVDANQTGLSRDDYKMTFLASLIRLYRDYVDFMMQNGDSDKALEIVESSRARILAETTAPEKAARRLSVRELEQAARRSNTVFLSYWLAPTQSYVWVVSPARTRFFKLGPAGELESLVDQFNRFIGSSADSNTIQQDPLAKESPVARRLYDAVIGPVAPFLPADARVVIVPDGALHYLNFETLPVYGAPGSSPHYWIEDATVAIAPSLTIAAATPTLKPEAPKSVLILGDAVYSGKDFQKLDYSPDEIEKVRRHFIPAETKVIRGADANPAAYRQADPQEYAAIHFSTHAEANQQSPLDSAIILSPGKESSFKLYARDVIDAPLHADLVTISACHSAGARVYSGEGLVGFAWAFLKAGAHAVVAGLWDVTDKSTPAMMDEFYGAMQSGRSPVAALRMAKLSMIHSTGAFRKPYYWGPFQIYIR